MNHKRRFISPSIVAYQLHAYAGSEFKIERQLWETRAAPRPTYLWSGTCPLQLRAYTQIPSCRRISGGLIAQVALLPFRGGGPLGPRGTTPSWDRGNTYPTADWYTKCNDDSEYIKQATRADLGMKSEPRKKNQSLVGIVMSSYLVSMVGIGSMIVVFFVALILVTVK